MQNDPDIQSIDEVLNGNTSSYATLVDKHKEMVFLIALRITGVREDAEEVAQDAFVKAFGQLKNFKRKSKFSTWLYRIAYNLAISKKRKKRVETTEIEDDLLENYQETEALSHIHTTDPESQIKLMKQSLQKLNPDDQLMISLYYEKDCSIASISEITGHSESNVKVKLHRLRKRLYRDMQNEMKKQNKQIYR